MYRFPKMARLGVLAMLLLTCGAAIPQQAGNRYTVEILVFRTASQSGALPGSAPAPVIDNDVEPTAAAVRKLAGTASRLRTTGGFKVLAHTAWTQAPTGWNSRRGVSAAGLGLTPAGISGKVMLERGQYLNLRLDLTIDDGGRRYHLSEVRRVKAGETHYFDHPAVGVLAVVTAGG